jgi:dTDP-4-amino-4,6-dideoxygalactose transaminase
LTTKDPVLAEKVMKLRLHGGRDKYFHEYVGINSRIDTLQAAVLKVKLPYLDRWTEARQRNAERYTQLLGNANLPLILPKVAPYQTRHVFNQYTILAERRDELKSFLAESGVGCEIYYPLPLHLQECFADLGYRAGSLPVSESCAKRALSLPVHPELAADDLQYVADCVKRFYEERA